MILYLIRKYLSVNTYLSKFWGRLASNHQFEINMQDLCQFACAPARAFEGESFYYWKKLYFLLLFILIIKVTKIKWIICNPIVDRQFFVISFITCKIMNMLLNIILTFQDLWPFQSTCSKQRKLYESTKGGYSTRFNQQITYYIFSDSQKQINAARKQE